MEEREAIGHFIIGTAGHIDHGKTALIQALTGRETDRLEEERRRGITIELGFTYLDLPDGARAGIVDVPGHEKFIPAMAAGASGADLVLLVVAADEGVMPQTREHVDILNYLGAENYILVISKCDLVDGEWLAYVQEEIRRELKGRIPDDTVAVPVSSVTMEGIDALQEEIVRQYRLLSDERGRRARGGTFPRLPVDRVFSKQGFGTVVTGTLIGGSVRKGDALCLMPEGKECRVRGIQIHGEEADKCSPSQRCALNLAGIAASEISRGDVLAPVGRLRAGRVVEVRLALLPDSPRKITNQMRMHFYSGTFRCLCRTVLLGREELLPGEECFAQLFMDKPAPVFSGDRFVIRFYSPVETIGGGLVLKGASKKARRKDERVLRKLEAALRGDREELLLSLVAENGGGPVCLRIIEEEMEQFGFARQETEGAAKLLGSQDRLFVLKSGAESLIWEPKRETETREGLLEELRLWCEEHPCRRGMPAARLFSGALSAVGQEGADAYLSFLEGEKAIRREGALIAPQGYVPADTEEYRTVAGEMVEAARRSGCGFLPETELLEISSAVKDGQELLILLVQDGRLVKLSEGWYGSPQHVREAVKAAEKILDEKGRVSISELRDALGVGRKGAKLVFDYTDRLGITVKDGPESERADGRKTKE